MKKFYPYIFVFTMIVLFSCCKKNQSDPCAGQVATSAKFQMLEALPTISYFESDHSEYRYFPTDTTFLGTLGEITFSALNGKMSSYDWKVGGDTTVWHSKSFNLFFPSPLSVNVSLSVKNNVNKACFPIDKGVDTTYQTLTAINPPSNFVSASNNYFPILPIMGKYTGYDSSAPNNIYTIIIKYDSIYNSGINVYVALHGFPSGCTYPYESGIGTDFIYGCTAFRVGDGMTWTSYPQIGPCKVDVYGWGELQTDHKTLIIDYTYAKDTSQVSYTHRIHDKFIGRKIN